MNQGAMDAGKPARIKPINDPTIPGLTMILFYRNLSYFRKNADGQRFIHSYP